MRTNIVIDDELLKRAVELSGLKTKRAVVEDALRLYVELKEQAGISALFGQLRWEGNLNVMREDRVDYSD